MSLRTQMRYMNPYEIHKLLVNEYILRKPGDTKLLLRDTSKDRTDYHVLKDNHKFLWDDEDTPESWEEEFAKKYYDKLFKEYCIADLTLYKENKIALRWRIEKEVISGKGQFICGNKFCNATEDNDNHLQTWEVNFAYQEKGEKKNALVKIRLCRPCSLKLNYHSKKREVKRLHKRNKHSLSRERESACSSTSVKDQETPIQNDLTDASVSIQEETGVGEKDESPWENHKPMEMKSREEEMEEYLQDLLL